MTDAEKMQYLEFAHPDDLCTMNQILEIRNDNREGFVSQETITEETHYAFMEKHRENYYVYGWPMHCGCIDEVVGFVGVVNDDIRFAVRKEWQGKGIGKILLTFIKEKYPNAVGKVKINNAASAKAFTKAGFQVWFTDEDFLYFSSKNVGSLSSEELHKLYNKYLMRCFYCSNVSTSSIDGLAVCSKCRPEYDKECEETHARFN